MTERFKTTVAIFVGLRNEKGEILLQQRINTGFMDGYWDFSASGHLEQGESIRECAVRELKEEIGIIANEHDLKIVHISQSNGERQYLQFTFILDEWQGVPKICEPDKCSDLRYFSPDNLPDKCTPNVRLNEREDFADILTYSYIDHHGYEVLMGEKPANGRV